MWNTNLALSNDIYIFKISSSCSGKEILTWNNLDRRPQTKLRCYINELKIKLCHDLHLTLIGWSKADSTNENLAPPGSAMCN